MSLPKLLSLRTNRVSLFSATFASRSCTKRTFATSIDSILPLNWDKTAEKSEDTTTVRQPKKKEKPMKEAKLSGVRPHGRTMRFYKEVGVQPFSNAAVSGWIVTLDGRMMKTPDENRFLLPTEELAYLVAGEWEAQDTKIRPITMPMTTLAATAIDQIPRTRAKAIDSMLSFLKTDSACCRSDEPLLFRKQMKLHDPLIKWFQERYQVPLKVSKGLALNAQEHNTMQTLQWMLFHTDDFTLSGLHTLSHNARSLIIALALYEKKITVEEAFEAALAEEIYQQDLHGLVEGNHDVERAQVKLHLSSSALFLHLLPPPKNKIV